MVRRSLAGLVFGAAALAAAATVPEAVPPAPDPRPADLHDAWKALPVPPITPYHGPFPDARAFVGKLDPRSPIAKAYYDWARLGTYDPALDPRPINEAYERAALEDWRRMGYNCAYKGNAFTFRVGRFLKSQGLLGAIDQTLWGAGGPPPLAADGTPGPKHGDRCGSFFSPENYAAGVRLCSRYVQNFGDRDMLTVGGVHVTSSWDEVGRAMVDYRPEAIVEYRRYLRDVWFQDEAPDRDTNRDGRTYDAFTGEKLTRWEDVEPPKLSPRFYQDPRPGDEVKWTRSGAYKLWSDFHRYFTFEFFRRTSAAVEDATGQRFACYPFPHGFVVWPGANVFYGLGAYWNARLNPILSIEQCWPDSPAMALEYAMYAPLVRRYHNVVMGWSWFYVGDEAAARYDGPSDIGRALARIMGRTVDGLHHWFDSPTYRGRQQAERAQLAYWHNFLAKHYQSFIARSEPVVPQVALLMPDYTGYFYRLFQYPKQDWAYTAEGLQEAQIPYDVVTEEQLELDPAALAGYKVLYVVGSEWTTPTIQERVAGFVARGGVVCADVDSLSLDITTGRRTDFLERTFGVRILRKLKNSFLPSAETPEEEAWAAALDSPGNPFWLQGVAVHRPDAMARLWTMAKGVVLRDEAVWAQLDALMQRMPRTVRGLDQGPLDMRDPPKIRYAPGVGPVAETTTWGEVDVAEALPPARPIAWYGARVAAVETDRTVWLGTREGMSLHAVSPRISMSQAAEPCNPFLALLPAGYASHAPYVDVIAYAARKAGVARPVTVTVGGHIPYNLEVSTRADAAGNLMIVVVNHDGSDETYHVAVDPGRVPASATAWNVLDNVLIARRTSGAFDVHIGSGRVAVLYVGAERALAPVQKAQAELLAMDLSVPRYFAERPELNASTFETTVPDVGR